MRSEGWDFVIAPEQQQQWQPNQNLQLRTLEKTLLVKQLIIQKFYYLGPIRVSRIIWPLIFLLLYRDIKFLNQNWINRPQILMVTVFFELLPFILYIIHFQIPGFSICLAWSLIQHFQDPICQATIYSLHYCHSVECCPISKQNQMNRCGTAKG